MTWNIFSWLETVIDSSTWELAATITPTIQQAIEDPWSMLTANVVVWIVIFVWMLCLIRTIKDIRSRTKNLFGQVLSILAVTLLTPIIWLPLYLVLRPKYTYKDKLYRREALDLQTTSCNQCWMINNFQFDHCISCWESIHHQCTHCDQSYSHEYNNCPYCGSSKNLKRTHK